jgi:hypothetical protein
MSPHRYYTLNENGEPTAEPDLMKWAVWYESANRKVAGTSVRGATVSTVFLGINHNFSEGPPILWETMIFGGPLDQEQSRCSGSREQAEAMHQSMLSKLLSHLAR